MKYRENKFLIFLKNNQYYIPNQLHRRRKQNGNNILIHASSKYYELDKLSKTWRRICAIS